MELKKGWLDKQFAQVTAEVREWPTWMQREAGFKASSQRPETSEGQRPVQQTGERIAAGVEPDNSR